MKIIPENCPCVVTCLTGDEDDLEERKIVATYSDRRWQRKGFRKGVHLHIDKEGETVDNFCEYVTDEQYNSEKDFYEMGLRTCFGYSYQNYIVKIIEIYHIPKKIPILNTSDIESLTVIINHIRQLDDDEIIDIILDMDPEFSFNSSTNRNELIGIYIMMLTDCLSRTKDVFNWSVNYDSDY